MTNLPSGEILSQNEIDALLSALSTGEVNAEEIKKEEEEKRFVLTISNGRSDFQKNKFVV